MTRALDHSSAAASRAFVSASPDTGWSDCCSADIDLERSAVQMQAVLADIRRGTMAACEESSPASTRAATAAHRFPLAEGADQIAADAALESGYQPARAAAVLAGASIPADSNGRSGRVLKTRAPGSSASLRAPNRCRCSTAGRRRLSMARRTPRSDGRCCGTRDLLIAVWDSRRPKAPAGRATSSPRPAHGKSRWS